MPRKRSHAAANASTLADLNADVILAARLSLAQFQKSWHAAPLGLDDSLKQLEELLGSLVIAGDNCSTLLVGRR